MGYCTLMAALWGDLSKFSVWTVRKEKSSFLRPYKHTKYFFPWDWVNCVRLLSKTKIRDFYFFLLLWIKDSWWSILREQYSTNILHETVPATPIFLKDYLRFPFISKTWYSSLQHLKIFSWFNLPDCRESYYFKIMCFAGNGGPPSALIYIMTEIGGV